MTFRLKSDLLFSDEIRFHAHGSDKLVIWFGGINEPHFNPDVAILSGCDMLTVRDAQASWYTRGITSKHFSAEQALYELTQVILDRGYRKLCLCGQSSGGYGALLYAHLLNADLCIAFSPQTRNFYSGQCQMMPHVKLQDIGELYRTNTKTKLIINMSRSERDHEDKFSWDDWRQVEKLREHPNATFLTHPYDNHAVSVKLREAGLLYKLTASLISTYLG